MAINRQGVSELPAPLQLPPDLGPQGALQAGQNAAYDYMDRVRVEITSDVQGQVAYDEIGKILDLAEGYVRGYLLTGNPQFKNDAESLIGSAFDTAVAMRALEGDPGATKLLKLGAALTSTPVQAAIAGLGLVLKSVPNPVSAGIGVLLTLGNQVASDKLHELEERRAHWRDEQAQRLVPAYRKAKEEQWRLKDALGGQTPQPVYVDRPGPRIPGTITHHWQGAIVHQWLNPLQALEGQAALTHEQARAAHAEAQTAAAEAAADPGNDALKAKAAAAHGAARAATDVWRDAEGQLLAERHGNPAMAGAFKAAELAQDRAELAKGRRELRSLPPRASAPSAMPEPSLSAPGEPGAANPESMSSLAPGLPEVALPSGEPSASPREGSAPAAVGRGRDLGPPVPSHSVTPRPDGAAGGTSLGLDIPIASSISSGSVPGGQAAGAPCPTPEIVRAICEAFLDGMIERLSRYV